jgi:hypothetical protein
MCNLAIKFKDDIKAIQRKPRAFIGKYLQEIEDHISFIHSDHKQEIATLKRNHDLAMEMKEKQINQLTHNFAVF